MVSHSPVAQPEESLKTAKDQIQIGPVPAWVESCPFPIDFKGRQAAHITYLLFDQQINAELRQTYFHVALRLDTMQAVQEQSPWRLDFEPRHQQITLHSIKTRRDKIEFDHPNLSSGRVIDRQSAGSTPQDRLTLLLMLEDVRPGDVLEWCYTVENRPRLLPEYCASIFTLPTGAPVGKFHFSLLFNPSRLMQWKSSEPDWRPVENHNNGETLWAWMQENYMGLPPEKNTPDWLINHPWIQVSDCPDWATVAAAFAGEWEELEDDGTVGEIAAGNGSVLQQTERAIQLLQDEYRYSAVNGELDGQPPMPPGVVVRRRDGDCKDLSFLLLRLLKRLGVEARLVLVNTVWRKSIAELLPAPGVFNHLLVEYQAGGESRWVDATLKRQCGGSSNRIGRDYGVGLPIAGFASQLVEPPGGSAKNSVYELKESILLDTTGASSLLAVVVAARGCHAEALRHEFESEGLEALAKKRLRLCADRFTNAKRVGALEYRDDRAANEFFLAEIFEIKDFLTIDPKSKWYKLKLPNDYCASLLKVPDPGPRRTPFTLPHPCNIVHTIELYSLALPPALVQQRTIHTEHLHFNRTRKTLAGNWTMKLTLSTLADAVPPESLEKHRETIEEIREESKWSILTPVGDPRPQQRGDFGGLPVSWKPSFSMPAPARPRPVIQQPQAQHLPPPDNGPPKPEAALSPPIAIPAPPTPAQPQRHKSKRRKRSRRNLDKKAKPGFHIAWICLAALVLILIVVLVARNVDRWRIFKLRPKPPAVPVNNMPEDN
jgi:hypothetical protein